MNETSTTRLGDMPSLDLGGLPSELVKRIQKEAVENDNIYQKRPLEGVDLSHIHYGHAEMLDWAIKQLPNANGSRVLDIGIGEGFSSVLLALRGAHVTGIEVSAAALERAAALARRYGLNITLRQMAAEGLQFEDASFDGILCMSAYHHLDKEKAAREFARVLRPGGRLVMIDPLATNPPAWLYRRIGAWFSREATSEEKPLRVSDLDPLRTRFRSVKWKGMYLLCTLLFGLDLLWNKKNRVVHQLTKAGFKWISPLDRVLLKVPGVSRMAWKIAVVAER